MIVQLVWYVEVLMSDLSEEELQELYAWIDEIPLTRQKKNISRDFSDGVLAAEVISHFLPKLVDLHNYSPANAIQQKLINWKTLNRKVLSRLNFEIPDDLLQRAAAGKQGIIEFILCTLRAKIEHHLQIKTAKNDYSNGSLFDLDQMVSTYQNSPAFYWPDVERGSEHEAKIETADSDLTEKVATYPTTNVTSPKKALLPSRIPIISSQRKPPISIQQSSFSHPEVPSKFLPSLTSGRQEVKHRPLPQTQRWRPNHYVTTVSTRDKNKDINAKYRLLLAEKDQKILEGHEYIQYLQMKLTRYEHLVHIKDMKIETLKKELETVKGSSSKHSNFQQRR